MGTPPRNHLGHGLERRLCAGVENAGDIVGFGDWYELVHLILFLSCLEGQHAGVDLQEGITIGWSGGQCLHAYGEQPAGLVFDHDRLLEGNLQPLGDSAGVDVTHAASLQRHDELDRPRRPVRLCESR